MTTCRIFTPFLTGSPSKIGYLEHFKGVFATGPPEKVMTCRTSGQFSHQVPSKTRGPGALLAGFCTRSPGQPLALKGGWGGFMFDFVS